MRENVYPDSVYRHYKGSLYEVIDCGEHTETGDVLVVYKRYIGDHTATFEDLLPTWIRPLEMFQGNVEYQGEVIPRFEHLFDHRKIHEDSNARVLH